MELLGLHHKRLLKHKTVDQEEELFLQVKTVHKEQERVMPLKVLMAENNQDPMDYIIQMQVAEELEERHP